VDPGQDLQRVERALAAGRIKTTRPGRRSPSTSAPPWSRASPRTTGGLLRRGCGAAGGSRPGCSRAKPTTGLDHNNVAKVFKRVLKRAKLPGFRGLRPAAQLCQPAAVGRGAPPVRQPADGARQPGHHVAVLRPVGPERRPALGGPARRRGRGAGGGDLEPESGTNAESGIPGRPGSARFQSGEP
jgi:hypothetical protein